MNRLNKIMADPEVYKCIFSGIKHILEVMRQNQKQITIGFEVLLLFLFIALMLLDNFACTFPCFNIRTI